MMLVSSRWSAHVLAVIGMPTSVGPLFVLVTSVETVTHRVILETKADAVPWAGLEDEICALVLRYLIGHSPQVEEPAQALG